MTNRHRRKLISNFWKIKFCWYAIRWLFTTNSWEKIYKMKTKRGKIFLPHSFIALGRRREIKWNLRSLKRISTHVKPRPTVYEWISLSRAKEVSLKIPSVNFASYNSLGAVEAVFFTSSFLTNFLYHFFCLLPTRNRKHLFILKSVFL